MPAGLAGVSSGASGGGALGTAWLGTVGAVVVVVEVVVVTGGEVTGIVATGVDGAAPAGVAPGAAECAKPPPVNATLASTAPRALRTRSMHTVRLIYSIFEYVPKA